LDYCTTTNDSRSQFAPKCVWGKIREVSRTVVLGLRNLTGAGTSAGSHGGWLLLLQYLHDIVADRAGTSLNQWGVPAGTTITSPLVSDGFRHFDIRPQHLTWLGRFPADHGSTGHEGRFAVDYMNDIPSLSRAPPPDRLYRGGSRDQKVRRRDQGTAFRERGGYFVVTDVGHAACAVNKTAVVNTSLALTKISFVSPRAISSLM